MRPSLRSTLEPFDVGFVRALLEGILGSAVLVVAVAILDPVANPARVVFVVPLLFLSSVLLICWPAWRMRRLVIPLWWLRAVIVPLRAAVSAVILIVASVVIGRIIWLPLLPLLAPRPGFHIGGGVLVGVFFLMVRTAMILLAWLRRHVRRRVRWQLMLSHTLVIVLTLITLTAAGSIVGTTLALMGTKPNVGTMALSTASILRASGAVEPLNRPRLQEIMSQIEDGTLEVRGQPPLAGLIPRSPAPSRILVLRPDGSILAGVRRGQETSLPVTRRTWIGIYRRPGLWQALRDKISAGFTPDAEVGSRSSGRPTGSVVAAAPLLTRGGRVPLIVTVQIETLQPSARQFLQGTLAVFGVSTVILILATAFPLLILSFVFSYLVARGFTQRLGAVSGVATAIASGDLSQRAPVTSANEIGRLAADVNRMAAHLETTMGELQAARARAVGALEARQQLVASISHELRTPLAIVRAHLESLVLHRTATHGTLALAERGDIPVPAATVAALQGETERLSALVDDLFTLSRAEAGGLHVHLEPADVTAIVNDVAASMGPLARNNGQITLTVEAQPCLPRAMVDADRLRQILANLVRNAVRHTHDGGIIGLSVWHEAPWVVITVTDTGEGIPPEHLPHVFDRFYRVDESRTRDSGGAGLGLAIVREFVELMGGAVTVGSVQGEGTSFRVSLPVA